ncbi:putative peptidase [Steroidobacter agaridevorans]|uniref:Putative peptidase n=1 Tax=Steroidobacter agaridevorans TaxID=2695856 RepID=A0A829YK64_9GAMM|nr:CocE/NonD family hydrolase [Steroidobacter agaridevorans]GFE83705.1 putative peptidase [Steroidobacter agaridevorans]
MQARVHVQWGVKIPLRDGIHLSATLYRSPAHCDPKPAIFTLTPYIGQTFHDQAMYFASHGYPFLTVDVRGRGDSEGAFRPFIQEAQDGQDVVEWLAQQAYCNGRVAMWGGSYGGYNQWSVAKLLPPHLATIVPVAAPYLAVDVWMRNNICYPYLVRWLTLVTGRASQDKIFWNDEAFWAEKFRLFFESGAPFKTLDSALGNPSATFKEWISHPQQGDYWDQFNPRPEDYSKITVPILTITGIYDSDQPGALMHYRRHVQNAPHAPHYLVIGPWHHAGTRVPQRRFAGTEVGDAGMLDLQRLHLEWYAWTMSSGPKPSFLRAPVAYYVMGAERWRYAGTLDAITAESKPLYLSSRGVASRIDGSGELISEVGNGAEDEYLYDPRHLGCAPLEASLTDPLCLRPTFPTENLRDQTRVYAMEGNQLVYHSAPFDSDVEISGFFKLTAWIAIDQPDTDFGVSVYEIDDRGSSLLLTFDCMRARYREDLRREVLVSVSKPLRYEFERFTFVSRLVMKGSRLRLVIGPLNSIHFQKNYNSGGVVADESIEDARTVKVKLFHDSAHPSALYVPLGQPEFAGPETSRLPEVL